MHVSAAFLVEFGILLLILGAVSAVAGKLGLSAVPLFLIAGLFVGPGGLLPVPAAAPFLEAGAVIGVVLLLLSLGLEFSADEFTQALRRHTPSGVVDLVLNAVPGVVAGLLLGLPVAGVVALGGITWVSSSGIVSRTLSDLGRLGYRETPAVLSVLVLEDVAMAVYLPMLGILLAGTAFLAGLAGVLVAVVALIGVLMLSRWSGPVIGWLITHDSDEQVLLRLLALTLLVAGAAEYMGISAAVGAFLVGLAVPAEAAESVRRVIGPLRDLFAAAFFLSFGYAIDPRDMPPALVVAALLAVVTAVTKVITGWFAARRDGVGARGRRRAGTALIARGEFSMVIAGLAVAAGVTEIGPLAATYVLLLAVGGSLLTRLSGQGRDRLAHPHRQA
ncbi:cation:proton antiporter [Nakamurella multipartita]|uniref:Sodium/hydrogen exchanger n=1 Tax=Nakamurella multipartita (strain ATCC 700099 / DSM 44233 / CIP 104796 / JCM 9543 / NBRC 105858 / Y-104) TaxID=479431 RepID=C8X659_NAKMY|nr:cation:proton antiporter [Nakamurella multipartita]ACV76830.1 sodium/hydrogen exchanger [Nakamurella multipartita DSM 44233]